MATITSSRREIPFFVPLLNPLMSLFVRAGIDLGPKMALVTVRGRRTGQLHTTPMTLFESGGRRYLFGTFGNSSWVRNARAAREVTLRRGRRHETLAAVALTLDEAEPVLRDFLSRMMRNPMMAPMLRTFYGVTSRDADFRDIARQHPGFLLREKAAGDDR